MKLFYLFSVVLLTACGSSRLVSSQAAPYEDHIRNKFLIIGISENMKVRSIFEKELQKRLIEEGLSARQSLNYFEPSFIYKQFSEEELLELERQLIRDGFDSVLVTKVESAEEKIAEPHVIPVYKTFRDNYYNSQVVQEEQFSAPEKYTVYHTQTSLYDLDKDETRTLVWTGDIDIVEPVNIKKDVRQYLKLLLKALKKERIIN